MTLEMWLVAVVRVTGSLPVLRWPFYGGLLALIIDQSDLFIINLVDLGGVSDYQTFDKYLDQVYLLAFLVVALRWQGWPRTVAVALYCYRFAGFVSFELTEERDLLLLFPNFFESWFLFIAGVQAVRLAAPLVAAGAGGDGSGTVRPEAVPGVRYPLSALAGQHHGRRRHGAVWRFITP